MPSIFMRFLTLPAKLSMFHVKPACLGSSPADGRAKRVPRETSPQRPLGRKTYPPGVLLGTHVGASHHRKGRGARYELLKGQMEFLKTLAGPAVAILAFVRRLTHQKSASPAKERACALGRCRRDGKASSHHKVIARPMALSPGKDLCAFMSHGHARFEAQFPYR